MAVRTTRDGPVLIVELNRPEARNAINSTLLSQLHDAVEEAQVDEAVRVVLLTGAGSAFCAGLDLKELRETGRNRRLEDTGVGPLPPLRKPLVGAVNGPAVTGGLELALRCHVLVGSTNAAFIDTHVRNGLTPRWGMSGLLPQAVGIRVAREMSLTGRTMGAAEALQRGVLVKVVEPDELLKTAIDLAREIASFGSPAVQAMLAMYAAFEAGAAEPATQLEILTTLRRFASP